MDLVLWCHCFVLLYAAKGRQNSFFVQKHPKGNGSIKQASGFLFPPCTVSASGLTAYKPITARWPLNDVISTTVNSSHLLLRDVHQHTPQIQQMAAALQRLTRSPNC